MLTINPCPRKNKNSQVLLDSMARNMQSQVLLDSMARNMQSHVLQPFRLDFLKEAG
jgi:hypothetical protein